MARSRSALTHSRTVITASCSAHKFCTAFFFLWLHQAICLGDGDHTHSCWVFLLFNSQVSSSSVSRFITTPPRSLALCHSGENSSPGNILNTGKGGPVLMAVGVVRPSSRFGPRCAGRGSAPQRWGGCCRQPAMLRGAAQGRFAVTDVDQR